MAGAIQTVNIGWTFLADQIVGVVRETQCHWTGGTEWRDAYCFLSVDSKGMVASTGALCHQRWLCGRCVLNWAAWPFFWCFLLLLGIIVELITSVQ